MYSWRMSAIWGIASVVSGLFFTLLSGLYVVKPLIIDGEVINFGFPLAWFITGRKGLFIIGPWQYRFVWEGFIVDFIIYGSLAAILLGIYFLFLPKRKKPAP